MVSKSLTQISLDCAKRQCQSLKLGDLYSTITSQMVKEKKTVELEIDQSCKVKNNKQMKADSKMCNCDIHQEWNKYNLQRIEHKIKEILLS